MCSGSWIKILAAAAALACAAARGAEIARLATAAAADGTLGVDCYARDAGEVRTVRVEVTRDGRVCARAEKAAAFLPSKWRGGTPHQMLDVSVRAPQTWTAENPQLYDVRVALLDGAGAEAAADVTRVGFRTVEAGPGGLRVNGRPVRLKGVTCRPTAFPCTAESVVALKALGANAVRFADGAPDAAFLDACDARGLYVIDELPPVEASTVAEVAAVRVTRDVNHPCVIAWAHPRARAALTCDEAFRAWDPQRRPVFHFGARDDVFATPADADWGVLGRELKGPLPVVATYARNAPFGYADVWGRVSLARQGAGCFFGELADYVTADLQKRPAFDALRDVWTAARCAYADGTLTFQNGFDFADLGTCTYTWSALSWKTGAERRLAAARAPCPPCPARGTVRAPSPSLPAGTEALEISVADRAGIELFRTRVRMGRAAAVPAGRAAAPPAWMPKPAFLTLVVSNDVRTAAGGRKFHTAVYHADPSRVTGFTCWWQRLDANTYRMDYDARASGAVAAAGVVFAVDAARVTRRTWFGRGPDGRWENCLTGGLLGRWQADAAAGFFPETEWVELAFAEGTLRVTALSGATTLGLFPEGDDPAAPDALTILPPRLGCGFWWRLPARGNGLYDMRWMGPASNVPYATRALSGSLLLEWR